MAIMLRVSQTLTEPYRYTVHMTIKYCIVTNDIDDPHYCLDGICAATIEEMKHFKWEPALFDTVPDARKHLDGLSTNDYNAHEGNDIVEWDSTLLN